MAQGRGRVVKRISFRLKRVAICMHGPAQSFLRDASFTPLAEAFHASLCLLQSEAKITFHLR